MDELTNGDGRREESSSALRAALSRSQTLSYTLLAAALGVPVALAVIAHNLGVTSKLIGGLAAAPLFTALVRFYQQERSWGRRVEHAIVLAINVRIGEVHQVLMGAHQMPSFFKMLMDSRFKPGRKLEEVPRKPMGAAPSARSGEYVPVQDELRDRQPDVPEQVS